MLQPWSCKHQEKKIPGLDAGIIETRDGACKCARKFARSWNAKIRITGLAGFYVDKSTDTYYTL